MVLWVRRVEPSDEHRWGRCVATRARFVCGRSRMSAGLSWARGARESADVGVCLGKQGEMLPGLREKVCAKYGGVMEPTQAVSKPCRKGCAQHCLFVLYWSLPEVSGML